MKFGAAKLNKSIEIKPTTVTLSQKDPALPQLIEYLEKAKILSHNF